LPVSVAPDRRNTASRSAPPILAILAAVGYHEARLRNSPNIRRKTLLWCLRVRGWAPLSVIWQRACMERLGIRDLVGRAMIDKKFLTDLVRDPVTMLADYDLSVDEKNAIMQAVGRKGNASDQERARDLQHVMMKRWAT